MISENNIDSIFLKEVFGVVQTILNLSDCFVCIYSICGSRSISGLLKTCKMFDNNRFINLIGCQSLFYFIGLNLPQIEHIIWFTKEKQFFSASVLNWIKNDYKVQVSTYNISSFDKVVKRYRQSTNEDWSSISE